MPIFPVLEESTQKQKAAYQFNLVVVCSFIFKTSSQDEFAYTFNEQHDAFGLILLFIDAL